ncbi:MAG: RNA polymerase sigma factor [Solirubrobacteraceae bacterium]
MQFEALYRENVTAIAGYFARRATDPQTVADLTSETFVRALRSSDSYEGRGSPRAWLFAIARAVYAQHWAELIDGRAAVDRLTGQIELSGDDLDDLADRIDAQRAGRELLKRIAALPELERSAIELVDLVGMAPRNAARALGISPGAMRVRLFRAHARLRKENTDP